MTEKVINAVRWIFHNFFLITIAVFIVIYLRWFRLTPLVFEYYNDPNGAYIVGLILLAIYIVLATLIRLARNRVTLRWLLFIPTILFFCVNIIHVIAFNPSITNNIKCNGARYYITWMHPFGDYQWTFKQVTKWQGVFDYDSFFFGYSGGPYEIICDDKNAEVHIVETRSMNRLAYTDGNEQRIYADGTQLGNHLYGLAYHSDNDRDSLTYMLYECELDVTDCHRIPFQYSGEYSKWSSYLEANEEKSEVNVYFNVFHGTQSEEVLIFTYGEHPRCYVEGCEILEQK